MDEGTADTADAAAAWSSVSVGDECELFVADPAKLSLAPPTWTDCGVGCTTAPGTSYGYSQMNRGNSSAVVAEGSIVLRRVLSDGVSGGRNRQQVLRLSDGTTLAVADQRGTGCSVTGNSPSAAFVLPYWHPKLGMRAGFVSRAGGVIFSPAWTSVSSVSVMTFGVEQRVGWGFKDGTVRLMDSTGSLLVIDSAKSPPSWASSAASLVVWPLRDSVVSELRAWRVGDTATKTWLTQADPITAVATTSDRVAWISVSGPEADLGKYAAARFMYAPHPTAGGMVSAAAGPTIDATFGLGNIQFAGDYVATVGLPADSSRAMLYVAQLSTGKTWSLRGPATDWFTSVLAVSEQEMLVAATDVPGTFANEVKRLVRIRLSALDGLAAAWSK